MPKFRTKTPVAPQKSPALAGARLDLLIYLALLLTTFAVYAQVRNFDFVNYDDHTIGTPNIHQGITADGLKWAPNGLRIGLIALLRERIDRTP